jgi:hypothetical protein
MAQSEAIAACPISIVAVLGAVAAALFSIVKGKKSGALIGLGIGVLGTVAVQLLQPGEWARALPLLLVLPATALLAPRLYSVMPEALDRLASKGTITAVIFALISLFSVVQVTRLSTYIADPEDGWFVLNREDFWANHRCIGAYLYAADMNRQGVENIYDNNLYSAWNEEAETVSEVPGMADLAPDPYLYPPQFLILPRLALSLTSDVAVIQQVYLALQITLFAVVGLGLAAWIGGSSGAMALGLLPLAMASTPGLHSFSYGQFHLATILLAVGGMLALAKSRYALGGAMLGFAVVAKLFPAILLIVLAFQKKWTEFTWTLGAIVVYTAIAFLVVGQQAFKMFTSDLLPRLSDGSAAAFDIPFPEFVEVIVAGNSSYGGILRKLDILGLVEISTATAVTAGKFIGLTVLIIAVYLFLKKAVSSEDRVIGWLSLIGLGSIAGTVAWTDYVPIASLVLACFLGIRFAKTPVLKGLLGLTWVTGFLVLGAEPLGTWQPWRVLIGLSLLTALVMSTTFITALCQSGAASDEAST